ncbi:MAG: BamA/TamA family outer membrane protein [Armatimonadetes bacterium]|nr:BamA/TamA family outer membrane protein [Armatimonadota bacterium]CUU37445.1 Beta-barrel assembly machine subunit BamA [Armatimonadetes bacterium DC]
MFTKRTVGWILLAVLCCTTATAQTRRIESVSIRGLRNVSENAVLTALRLKPGEVFSESLLESDRNALIGMGLFSAVRPRVEQTETGVRIQFEVVENPLIKEVQFFGNTVFRSEQLLELIRNKPGMVFNTNFTRIDAEEIVRAYAKEGYAALIEGIVPDEETGTVRVYITELKVNSIRVEGNTKTQPYVILREVRTKPGDLYNLNRWQRDLNRILNTGYFETVQYEENISEGGATDLIIRVKEQPTGRLNVGFAVDSRRRLIGLAEIYETNFRGRGQTVGLNFQSTGGRRGNSIELLFSEPYLDSRGTRLSVSLYDKLVYRFTSNFFGGAIDPNLEQQYDERRRGVSLSLGRPLNDFFSATIGVRTEDVNTNRVATSTSGGFIRQDGSMWSLSLRGVYNTRDFDLDPATGQYLSLTLEPGQTNIRSVEQQFLDAGVVRLGRSNFLRIGLDYRFYYSPQGARRQPDDRRQVLAVRFYYGTISGNIPFFEQFFIGGAETLRGYPEDRFWGRNAALLSFEWRQPIEKSFTGVLFVDIGHAWGGYPTVNQFTQSGSFKPQVGFGFGIRVRTPIGPLRVDYGIGRDGGRTHFSIGQQF